MQFFNAVILPFCSGSTRICICWVLTLKWIVYAVIQSSVHLKYTGHSVWICLHFSICTTVYLYIYGTCIVFAVHICFTALLLELVLYFQWTIEIGGQSAICSRDLGESWTQWWRERNLSKWKSWKCLRFEIPSRFSVRRQYWMFSDSVSAKV